MRKPSHLRWWWWCSGGSGRSGTDEMKRFQFHHPHISMRNGIILASARRKQSCIIQRQKAERACSPPHAELGVQNLWKTRHTYTGVECSRYRGEKRWAWDEINKLSNWYVLNVKICISLYTFSIPPLLLCSSFLHSVPSSLAGKFLAFYSSLLFPSSSFHHRSHFRLHSRWWWW